MDLVVLGAGPAYSDRPGSTGAAYLLSVGNDSLLLDLGQGSFPRLAAQLDPADLVAVVVSHLHPDHFVDLVPLRHYLRYERPGRRVTVHGPGALGDRLDGLLGEPGFTAASLDALPLRAGSMTIGPFRVEAARVTHTDESYAFRVTVGDGLGLVYSGDCGRAADLRPLIRPGDALLSEVSFGQGPMPVDALHLDGPAVGALATETRAGRVLLTHLQMGFDPEATIRSVHASYDGDVRFVWPGDRLSI
ncbi:MAG: MBL fold metallo-hydrolase [Chloroflexi bacterium]|nr:MAG: MBL fold metallo-hydrolase [Chloroflexota bacterium]